MPANIDSIINGEKGELKTEELLTSIFPELEVITQKRINKRTKDYSQKIELFNEEIENKQIIIKQYAFINKLISEPCLVDFKVKIGDIDIIIEDKYMNVEGSVFEKIETFIFRCINGSFNECIKIFHYSGKAFEKQNYKDKIESAKKYILDNDKFNNQYLGAFIFNTQELEDFMKRMRKLHYV
jgi:hypothetical protein